VVFELVVVDNASTDGTAAVVRNHWHSLGAPARLTLVNEPEPGLIYARKAGLQAARFEVCSFIDDDNWICQDWCGRVAAALGTNQRLAAIGGRGVAYFEETEAPEWFERYQTAYAVGPQTEHSRGRRALSRLYGAGLTIRKSALDELTARGFLPMCAGRVGTKLSAGDDTELCYALALAGWDLACDSNLVFQHVIPAKRLSENYLVEMFKGFGASSAVLDLYGWIAFRRRRNPVELAISFRIIGLSTSLAKLLYWRVRVVLTRPLDASKQLEARVRIAYFAYRFHALHGSWRAACRQAKELSKVFFFESSLPRTVSY
jgi:glycosyltransferase involved in cell wall biosynthesis